MKGFMLFIGIILGFALILVALLRAVEEKKTRTCNNVDAVKVRTDMKYGGYICVREGLIVDKNTGEVIGL